MLAFEFTHELRNDALRCLRLDRGAIVHAVLRAEFDKEKAQEMPDFSCGANCGLSPAARQALLNRDGRWNAVDRINFWPSCRLHNAARVSVQAF